MTLPLSHPQAQDHLSTDNAGNSYPFLSIYPQRKMPTIPQSSSTSSDSDDAAANLYPAIRIYAEPESTQAEELSNTPPKIRVQPPRRSATIATDGRPAVAGEDFAYPNLSIYPVTPTHPNQNLGRSVVGRPVLQFSLPLSFHDDMAPSFKTSPSPRKERGISFSAKSKMKDAMDGHSVYSSTSTLLNLSSETLNTLASDREVSDFLTSDEDHTEDESHHLPNPRLRRRASLPSIMTTDSVVSHSATLPLRNFCDLISRCHSLERAKIVSVECYKEKGAPKHRFLMFHCIRGSRPPVWFRVDRRIEGSVAKLLFSRGTANAKDTVRIAVNKADLLGITPADQENELLFTTYPNLGAFRFFLDIISEEMTKYELWPQNCWFLCSVLQEHLRKASEGKYARGGPVVPDIAPDIRSRIDVRVYHEPTPMPPTDKLIDLIMQQNGLGHMASSIFKNTIKLAGKAPRFPPQRVDLLNPPQIKKLADALHEFANSSIFLGPNVLCLLSARSVGIYRHLYRHNPGEYYSGFSESLLAYAPRLQQSGRRDEALYCYSEALDAQRDQYKRDPEAYRFIFLASLTEHADRLAAAGRLNDACIVQLEIVKVFKVFYDMHPPRENHFTLAGHRRSYISRLLKAGRPEEDVCAEELEIVRMARVLHRSDPSEYNWVLADCLYVYAGRLTSSSRLEDACLALAEAVQLRRVQYKEDPNEHLKPFIASLAKYKDALSRAEREGDVRSVDQEVLDIYREAFARDPRSYWRTTAEALREHIGRLSQTDRGNETDGFERELVELHRKMYEIEPDDHHEAFCNAVSDYTDWLSSANRIPEACDALLQIVELHRELFESDPHRHHERLAGFLEVYFGRLSDFGRIQDAADIAEEVLTMYHTLWKKNPSVYFKQVLNAVIMYDAALNSAGYTLEGPSILVDVHRARYRNDPDLKNARGLAAHLTTYAKRLDEVARRQDACDAALELADILRKHPLPPRSEEAMPRTHQLHACSLYVAEAQQFQQALDIAELAMQVAQSVEETKETLAWVQQWRPKTKQTYNDIKRVVGIKKQPSQIRVAQTLGLTSRDGAQVDETPLLPLWVIVALSLSVAAALVAIFVARR